MAKALVFLAPGFEEIETLTVVDVLRRAEVDVTVAGLTANVTEGKHGVKVVPDKTIDDVKVEDFDAVVVPGGNPGYKNLRKDPRVIAMVKKAFNSNKIVAAICAGPTVLSDAGVLAGKACTIYPGMDQELEAGGGKPKHDIVVVDGNIITSRGPATALPFALKLAEKLAGKQVAEAVSKKTLTNILRW
ncbi:MAG TPA: DJ-1/PfpI family protein [Candidatus Bathyarchaeota archaeon]|nr:DJ-1/PfpI family protein [Candidatus Bathyarchaeota archaeon]